VIKSYRYQKLTYTPSNRPKSTNSQLCSRIYCRSASRDK